MSSDLDKYRQPHESDEHWAIRKEFLERYQSEFDEDRLQCLAQVYSNMELLDCSYPLEVEQQVRGLAANLKLSRELKGGGKDKNTVHFVREESDTSTGNKKNQHRKQVFVHSAEASGQNNETNNASTQVFVRSAEASGQNNETNNASTECRLPEMQHLFNNQPRQRSDSTSNSQEGENESNAVLPVVTKKRTSELKYASQWQANKSFKEYTKYQILMDTQLQKKFQSMNRFIRGTSSFSRPKNPLVVLNDTCKKFDMPIDYHFEIIPSKYLPEPIYSCAITMKGIFVAESSNPDQERARSFAARKAFDIFQKSGVALARDSEGRLCLKPSSISDVSVAENKKELLAVLKHQKNFKKMSKFIRENFAGTKTPFKALTSACKQVKMSLDCRFEKLLQSRHSCIIKINDVLISESSDLTEEDAHLEASRKAFTIFLKKDVFIATNSVGELYLNSSDVSNSHSEEDSEDSDGIMCTKKRKVVQQDADNQIDSSIELNLDDGAFITYLTETSNLFLPSSSEPTFMLFDNSEVTKIDHSGNILMISASFCHFPLNFEHEEVTLGDKSGQRCKIFLNNKLACEAIGKKKTEAKKCATDTLLDELKRNYYTIKVKDPLVNKTTECIITRDLLMSGKVDGLSVSDDNIGHKMLKMMGWSGGAIGKDGQSGIIEPVKADIFREKGKGLGFSESVGQDFLSRVENILNDYMASNSMSDLVFSTEFTIEERQKIHRRAVHYKLKSLSRGPKSARQLVISRKFTAPELFKLLRDSGGKTTKYELVPPGNDSSSND